MPFLTTLGLISGGVGAVSNFITGSKMARDAESKLSQFRHQELTNLAENLKPSLEAERQMQVAASKQRAAFVDVAQGMDAAQAMGMMAAGLGQTQDMEMQAFSNIMNKEYEADVARVQEEQNIRGIIEARNMEELQSLKAQAQAGKQMQASAITDFASMAVSAGLSQELSQAEAGKTDPTATRVAKAASRRGASGEDISKAYNKGGVLGVKELNRGVDNTGFLGGGTKVGGVFKNLFN